MTRHLSVVSHSEVGLVRKNNQDSGYASPHLLVVADGMGGAAAGDLASAVAIDSIRRLDTDDLLTGPVDQAENGTEDTVVVPLTPPDAAGTHADTAADTAAASGTGSGADAGTTGRAEAVTPSTPSAPEQGAAGLNPLLTRFAASIAEANDRIADLVAADYSLEGMGTTVTGAIFDGARLGLAHIGDSRGYLLRDGSLERLTHDHSWVQSLVDDGKISPEEAAYHPHRSLLLKVLNGQPANDPDLTTVEVRVGDRLLLCSDGLCGLVDDARIAVLAGAPDLRQAVADLVDEALGAGGIDNITVILAEVRDGPDPAGTGSRAGATGPVVLGAAAEREVPAAPAAPGSTADAESDDDEDEDASSGVRATAPAAARTGPPGHADDESRYAPRPPHRRRLLRTLLVGLVILLVTGAGLGAGYAWTRAQYFVGASQEQVAIYQGLPDGVPGLPLSQVYEVQDLPVASLPPYYQAQVLAGIEVSSLDAARQTVAELTEAARRCAQPPARPSPTPPRPRPTPTTTPTTGTGSAPSTTPPAVPGPAASVTETTRSTTPPTTGPTAESPPQPTPTASPGQDC